MEIFYYGLFSENLSGVTTSAIQKRDWERRIKKYLVLTQNRFLPLCRGKELIREKWGVLGF